jgi:transcriptional regulator with XRE-family HTH domain
MSLNYQAIGHRIMVIRKRNRISQLDFSERIDKSPTYVSYIENGKKRMSLETFVQIANALIYRQTSFSLSSSPAPSWRQVKRSPCCWKIAAVMREWS